MLIQLQEDDALGEGVPFATHVRALPRGGYRSLDLSGRKQWLEEALAALGGDSSTEVPPGSAVAGGRLAATRAPARTVSARPRARRAGSGTSGLSPSSPIDALPGIGKATSAKLEKLGLATAGDAVFFFPRRFNDFTAMRSIAELTPGAQFQTVTGTVFDASQMRRGRHTFGTQAVITDATGSLRVVWFNRPYIANSLHEGMQVVLAGKVSAFRGRLQMQNPEFELVDSGTLESGRLAPVYPATQGITQGVIRRAVKVAVDELADRVADPVPHWLARERRLSPVGDAIRAYHYPASYDAAERARERLALGELLAIQVAVLQRRAEWQQQADAPCLSLGERRASFLNSLPFRLTAAQASCLSEIERDIQGRHPMLRLLQGDVGSGKTIVAFAAMLAAIQSGYQAVLMAPTEILAEQHYRSLMQLLGAGEGTALDGVVLAQALGRPLRALLLTGSLSASQKQQIRADAAHDGADVVIGTHALLEDDVDLPRLGLAVIDEQHRFGVMQRVKLRQKGMNPHLLVMTATPIPRTLALTVYGDLDVSTIHELPPGRLPIRTRWYQPDERADAYRFLRNHLDAGEQAFVICPLVEESETLDVRSAEEEYAHLLEGPLRGYRLELLHGRMTGRQKDEVMTRFAAHEADVLVSTSVIEVGIDIPNATIVVIEGAERFGLSQLHQFRGRVGRSSKQSYCVLFSSEDDPGPEASERLRAMAETNDGFRLAEIDLAMRGEGEAWGRLQSGANTMLRVARLTDRELLTQAREMAVRVLARDPYLQKAEHHALAAAVRPFQERATEAN